MAPDQGTGQPVLVYDRVDENRRKSAWLITGTILGTVPAALLVSAWAGAGLLMYSGALATIEDLAQDVQMAWFAGGMTAVAVALAALAVYRFRGTSGAILRQARAQSIGQRDEALRRTVESLCIGAGLRVPALYVSESPAPNAFAVGVGPEEQALVVTRGLVDALDRLELEGVLAHELCHIGNEDVALNTTLAGILRTFVLPVPLQLLLWAMLPMAAVGLFAGDWFSEAEVGTAIYWLFVGQFAIVLWTLTWPWIGRLLQHALSRRLELLADAQAVLLTRYPDGLARALLKLDRMNAGGAPFGTPLVAHLLIVGPPRAIAAFATHPPIEQRVAALVTMGASPREALLAQVAERPVAQPGSGRPAETDVGAGHPAPDEPEARVRRAVRAGVAGLAVMAALLATSLVSLAVRGGRAGLDPAAGAQMAAQVGFFVAAFVAWASTLRAMSAGRPGGAAMQAIGWAAFLLVGAPALMFVNMTQFFVDEGLAQAVCGTATSRPSAGETPLTGPCGMAVVVLVALVWIAIAAVVVAFADRLLSLAGWRAWEGLQARLGTRPEVARPPAPHPLPTAPVSHEAQAPPAATAPPAAQAQPERRESAAVPPLTRPAPPPVAQGHTCPKCGWTVTAGAVRCQWCGHPATDEREPSAGRATDDRGG